MKRKASLKQDFSNEKNITRRRLLNKQILCIFTLFSLVLSFSTTSYAKAEDKPIITQGEFGATFNTDDSNNINGEKDLNDSNINSRASDDPFANVSFTLDHYIPLDADIFELRCTVVSNKFVNGTKGKLKLTNGNFLNPITLYDEYVYFNFPSSKLRVGTIDYVEISPDISLIKGNYSNCYVYFNEYGWVSGLTYYGDIKILR